MKAKVYDCFCFFNEDMLLKLRFDTLWDQIDYFVLCESVITISGNPKPLHFDISKFEKYKSKIRHLIVKDYPFNTIDAWRNERFQRNFISEGLFDATDSDLILISDVDEIPEPSLIKSYDANKYLRGDFVQRNYAYFLNNLSVKNNKPTPWYGSKITTYRYFKDYFYEIERIRTFKSSGFFRALKRVYFGKFKVQTINNGGWHFSWIGNAQKIIKKLESFAHQEYNKPEFKNLKLMEDRIRNGEHILIPGIRYEIQEMDSQFPKALLNNLDLYKSSILIKK